MAKVRFIGDPGAEREHRDSTTFAGFELPRGKWVDMDDAPARKLSRNSHFEVMELPDFPQPSAAPVQSDEFAKLKAEFDELAADRLALIDAYHARGADLQAALARVQELEAALVEAQQQRAAPAAQGEGNGDVDSRAGESGANADQGARRRANRQS